MISSLLGVIFVKHTYMQPSNLPNLPSGRVTLRKLAEMAATTPATVSRALSGKKGISAEFREKIQLLAQEHGYIPNQLARNMVSGSSTFVGFLAADLNNPFYISVFRILESLCRGADFSLLIADSERDSDLERLHITQFLRMNVRGIALFPVSDWNSESPIDHLKLLTNSGLPSVAFGQIKMRGISTVVTEEWLASANVVAQLRELGHRRFLFVTGNRELNVPALQRRRSILSAADGSIDIVDAEAAGWQDEVVRYATRTDRRPTAIIAVSDVLALQLYSPLMRAGLRVPEDVSLCAYGCNVWAQHIYPSLSLSEPDAEKQARLAFAILAEKIANPDVPDQHIMVPQVLRLRDSVSAPLRAYPVAHLIPR
jgi:LacI family transcriptional regulator